MKILKALYFILFLCFISCEDEDEQEMIPAEERIETAINDLEEQLTAPQNGWRISYRPTPGSGIFFMLLDFDDDGLVTIKSDVVDNEGEFLESTIPYRIDNGLGLELIFETYAVFHYLFEKDQASFGAEFEFVFSGEQNGNLIFASKSDQFNRTVVTFEPAGAGDENLFSTQTMKNLSQFRGLSPQIFGAVPPVQQVVLHDKNISIFWSIDLTRRMIEVDMAGVGTTMAEVNASNNKVRLNHTTGYAVLGGKLVLIDPFSFELNGETITISEISLNNFSVTGPSFCSLSAEKTPVYEGEIADLGQVTLFKSLFDSGGMDFRPMESALYSVNVFFVFDGNAESLFEGGIISDKFPNATGFIFTYGLNSTELPANSVGLVVEDSNGEGQLYLREFEPTTTEGNKVKVTFTNNFYYSGTPEPADEQNLIDITNKIFEGEEVYASDLTGLNGVFRLFNPCNQYEFFLVQ